MATLNKESSPTLDVNPGEHRNEQASVEGQVLASGTTQFATDAIVQEAEAAKVSMSSPLIPIRDQSIADFMEKPMVLSHFTWTTTEVEMYQYYNSSIGSLLKTNTVWAEKFRGFENLRATACFRLTINTNPFQQGKLIMSFVPTVSSLNSGLNVSEFSRSTCRCALTQLPNVEIDARDTAAVIKIPYISPYDFFNIKNNLFDWGTIRIHVLSRLRTGSGGDTSVSATLFGWFEDFELAAPMYPQSSKPANKRPRAFVKSGKSTDAAESEAVADKPISHALSVTATVAQALASVPDLTAIAQPVAWVARGLAGLASWFGYAKVESKEAPLLVVQRAATNMANYDGVTNPSTLALFHDNATPISDDIFGTTMDEMSLEFLKSHESYLTEFTWNVGDPYDTPLTTFRTQPSLFCEQFSYVRGPKTITANQWVPFAFLTKFFNYWRGSIELHFKIVKTEFHTGRLMFTFTPSISPTSEPTIAQSQLSLREIVDIRGNSEFTVKLPYLIAQKYLTGDQASGRFQIRILNTLCAPETCSQSVQVLVYARAGPDFEFQYPGIVTTPEQAFVPQAGQLSAPDHDTSVVTDVVGSYAPTRPQLDTACVCFGEQPSSVKQLLNRYTPVNSSSTLTSSSAGVSAGAIEFNPFCLKLPTNDASGNIVTPTFYNDALSIFSAGYGFYKGSIRIMSLNTATAANVCMTYMYPKRGANLTLNPTLPNSIFAGRSASNSGSFNGVGAFQLFNSHTGILETKVPYYNTCHMTPVNSAGFSTSAPSYSQNPAEPDGWLGIWTPSSATPYQLFRSASDDFQFGYFLGFPTTFVSSV